MGWRFRQSFKIIPGVKLNLSKTGLSVSVGGAPLTLNVGPHGVRGTASLPGTGLSFRQQFVSSPERSHVASNSTPSLGISRPVLSEPPHIEHFPSEPLPVIYPVPPPVSTAPVEEVHSASTELLTSESLQQLKNLLQTTFEERTDIENNLKTARQRKQQASDRYWSWQNGFLCKRVFKKAFSHRTADFEKANAEVAELDEQLRLTTVAAHVEIDKEQADPYFRMRDSFAVLSECAAIWDIKSHQATDRYRERTTATQKVERERVAFTLGTCDLIQWEQKVPHLANRKGGDIFLYPGFILYRAARSAFSVIAYHDVNAVAKSVQFYEADGVPTDSKIIGQTWAKTNKDGSRDRRFADNRQIPIVHYASLTLTSQGGLWEEFQFSNPEHLIQFLKALDAFISSFGSQAVSALPKP